jgi:hypothetical protein
MFSSIVNWFKKIGTFIQNNPPFNLSLGGTIAVLVFVGFIILALAIPNCHATNNVASLNQPYVQLSGGAQIIHGPTEVFDLSFIEPSNVLPHSFWQFGMMTIGGSHFKGKLAGNTLVWRALFCDGLGQFDFGIGASYMTNYLPYNGGHVNANLQVDYRFVNWPITITFTHFSDAGSVLPNYGRNIVMVGYRF